MQATNWSWVAALSLKPAHRSSLFTETFCPSTSTIAVLGRTPSSYVGRPLPGKWSIKQLGAPVYVPYVTPLLIATEFDGYSLFCLRQPCHLSQAQCEATERAGQLAGLEKVKLMREPEAAALAYGLDKVSRVWSRCCRPRCGRWW